MPPTSPTATTAPFIAADVGGTHVRIGLIRADADPSHPIRILDYRKYVCADSPGLDAIIADFLSTLVHARPCQAALAIAGHVLEDGTLISANLPWPVSIDAIRTRCDFDDLRLVNDFEAVAHAIAEADASGMLRLVGQDTTVAGPILVVGPGTGLGAAVHIPGHGGGTVLATEAGHAALSVGTAREIEVLQRLLREQSHVATEHVLSGPGLLRLYGTICALHGTPPTHDTPRAVTAAAQEGGDPRARETLEMFCGLLGSSIGDMALLYGAHGGVRLAGGILPQIRDFLLRSDFARRFLDKGAMRGVLERIPVELIEHGQLGVLGAARWYLGHAQAPQQAQGRIEREQAHTHVPPHAGGRD